MATIPELLDGHITLEVECLDRLYLNGYIGKLATGAGLSMFMRFQFVLGDNVRGIVLTFAYVFGGRLKEPAHKRLIPSDITSTPA